MRMTRCEKCNGIGKLPSGECNCVSGEGCGLHSAIAIGLWGPTCPACNGRGKKRGGKRKTAMRVNRRTWLKSITGAFATLATGLGLRKVGKKNPSPPSIDYEVGYTYNASEYLGKWKYVYSKAHYDGQRRHFEDVKPEEET